MRELALHLLDLLENSVAAGATTVVVRIAAMQGADCLDIQVDDNGHGLRVLPEQALDPFYTTKKGKRTGLGLSLLRATAQAAGGDLSLGTSELGGVHVEARMQLGHVDRVPLGDLASTISTIACTHPELGLQCELATDQATWRLSVRELLQGISPEECDVVALALRVAELIRGGQQEVGMVG